MELTDTSLGTGASQGSNYSDDRNRWYADIEGKFTENTFTGTITDIGNDNFDGALVLSSTPTVSIVVSPSSDFKTLQVASVSLKTSFSSPTNAAPINAASFAVALKNLTVQYLPDETEYYFRVDGTSVCTYIDSYSWTLDFGSNHGSKAGAFSCDSQSNLQITFSR